MNYIPRSLMLFCASLMINGCVSVSTQELPENWPKINKKKIGDCLDISGVYQPASVYLKDDKKKCVFIERKSDQAHESANLSCISLLDAMLYSGYFRKIPLSQSITPHTPIKISQNKDSILLKFIGEDGKEEQRLIYRDKHYVCTPNKISLVEPSIKYEDSWNIGAGGTKWRRLFYKGEDDSLMYKESTSLVGAILLPPFAVGSYTNSWARWKIADIDYDRLHKKFIYQGKTKEEIINGIGEPINKYFCAQKYRYIEIDELPKAIQNKYGPGEIIQVETVSSIVWLEVKRYENNKYLIGIDEFGGKEVRIPIDQIEKIWERRVVYGEDAWEYEEKHNIYGGNFLHFKQESKKAYRSSTHLPSEKCSLISNR